MLASVEHMNALSAQVITLENIRIDARAQPRDHLNTDIVQRYMEDMGLGAEFPPLTVFHDGSVYWLADGFHRHYAAQGLGLAEFHCDVLEGSLRDAVLYSCGANAAHGYARSNADKRRAVTRLLEDEEWRQWSDREIARQCRVDGKFVGKLRDEMYPVTADIRSEPRTYRNKHGGVSAMNTGGINEGRDRTPSSSWSPTDVSDKSSEPDWTPAYLDKNSYIWNAYRHAVEEFEKLPSVEDAVEKMPAGLAYTVKSDDARRMAEWFSRFADAWDRRND